MLIWSIINVNTFEHSSVFNCGSLKVLKSDHCCTTPVPLTKWFTAHAPMPPKSFAAFQIGCPSVLGSPLSPLSATCCRAVTFWQCCGNMMRMSCLRDLSPQSHSQLGVCFCVFVYVCETVSSQHNGGLPRFMGYLLGDGSFVVVGAKSPLFFYHSHLGPRVWSWGLEFEGLMIKLLKTQIMSKNKSPLKHGSW